MFVFEYMSYHETSKLKLKNKKSSLRSFDSSIRNANDPVISGPASFSIYRKKPCHVLIQNQYNFCKKVDPRDVSAKIIYNITRELDYMNERACL